jgi:hypothetical protein
MTSSCQQRGHAAGRNGDAEYDNTSGFHYASHPNRRHGAAKRRPTTGFHQ